MGYGGIKMKAAENYFEYNLIVHEHIQYMILNQIEYMKFIYKDEIEISILIDEEALEIVYTPIKGEN